MKRENTQNTIGILGWKEIGLKEKNPCKNAVRLDEQRQRGLTVCEQTTFIHEI